MTLHRYFLPDFVEIQRESFLNFLKEGILEEFSKRNPITNMNRTIEIFFYPEYFCLTKPNYSVQQAIFFKKSYTSKLYIPIQYTDKKKKKIFLKWILISQLPLMTKRGHFLLNGAARVIINQLVRSPGVYFRENFYEIYLNKWDSKPTRILKRFYADIICLKGTWVRIEIDKDFCMWVRLKKGPKIPLLWFLLGMGLNEKMIFQSVVSATFLLKSFQEVTLKNSKNQQRKPKISQTGTTLKNTPLLENFQDLEIFLKNKLSSKKTLELKNFNLKAVLKKKSMKVSNYFLKYPYVSTTPEAWKEIAKLFNLKKIRGSSKKNTTYKEFFFKNFNSSRPKTRTSLLNSKFGLRKTFENSNTNVYVKNSKTFVKTTKILQKRIKETVDYATLGRKWFFQRFMNPRTYDLGKKGRLALNKKLGLTISPQQTTLTAQDLLFITNYLMKVEKGFYAVDDIDHLKNKRIRSAGELIQMQFGIGLMRLEKAIRLKLNTKSKKSKVYYFKKKTTLNSNFQNKTKKVMPVFLLSHTNYKKIWKLKFKKSFLSFSLKGKAGRKRTALTKDFFSLNSLIQPKFVNGALREFFGTHPLSQFMDQINPLSEITHKRRLSSLGPGGVSRDTATLAIRGIHPSHYGRICPIETPEGKNTGLVNSLTVYARVNNEGLIESPFYSLYKGQIQKPLGKFYLSADQEEHFQTSTPDLNITDKNFLPKQRIPVRFGKNFFTNTPTFIAFIGVSPLQMISVATSLIPFLEHDDANRALMGSNMQRQAVPLIRPRRPLIGTGLEAKAISDSGHALTSSRSGIVLYVSGSNIILYTNKNL